MCSRFDCRSLSRIVGTSSLARIMGVALAGSAEHGLVEWTVVAVVWVFSALEASLYVGAVVLGMSVLGAVTAWSVEYGFA